MKIFNDEELECASNRLDELWSVKPWQSAYEEREELIEAIVAYEDEHVHIPPPDPITAIKFCMEHRGILPSDLSHIFGSTQKVLEILSGEQPLTDEIIFKLHTKLGIPLRSLLGHEEGITLGEFIKAEIDNLERFEKWWLSLHPKDKRGYPLTQESSDDWLDEYERWKQRKFID